MGGEANRRVDTTRPSLLIRVKDPSDRAAWETFDAIYRPMLIRYAQRHGVAAVEAEEIAQDCLGTIARRIEAFDYDPARGRFKGWLATMVRNRVLNQRRSRRAAAADSGVLENTADAGAAPDEFFERVWLEEHLWHCLREIERETEPVKYRAYVAYVIEERSVEDVCAMTGLTASNLYTIKWRITQRIAERMRELTHDDAD